MYIMSRMYSMEARDADPQSLSGASDDELLRRMVKTHPERFEDAYWKFFDAHVAPHSRRARR